MAATKTTKITFWVTTILIFLFEGVMPALTGHTEMAKEGIRHLGYPEYFGTMLVIWKVLGSISITVPKIPSRIKEWAYFGLALSMFSAFVSNTVVDGLNNGQSLFPLVILAILVTSYVTYHKLKEN
jgi:hypothetical protein